MIKKLMTDAQRAEYETKLASTQTGRTGNVFTQGLAQAAADVHPSPRAATHKPKAVWKFENGRGMYQTATDGERNTILTDIALRGRSLEITGHYLPGETREMLIQDSYLNGYIRD